MVRTLALVLALTSTLAAGGRAGAVETVTPLANIPISGNTGEKPQSKLWLHAGHWWAVFAASGGTWLWRLEADHTWTKLLRLATGTGFKADVKSFGDVAHVLLQASAGQLVSLEYTPGLDTYVPWSVRPGATALSLSGSETATLDVDTTLRLWVATESGSKLNVYYSEYPYTAFVGPITLDGGIHADDIGFVVSLPLPLPSRIGVFWSNQVTKFFGFRTHRDTDPPNLWSTDERPASQSQANVGDGLADDHMNPAVGSDGTLYVAVKTSFNSNSLPLVGLLKRRPNGSWDRLYEVERGNGTRGIALLNEDVGIVRVVYTANSGGGNIYYRDSPVDPIGFGARKTLFSGNLNNPTSTKDNWTDQLVVVASGRAALFTETGVVTTTSSTSTSRTSTSSTSTSSTSSSTATTAPGATVTTSTTASTSTSSSTTSTTIPANATGTVGADVSVVSGSSTRFGGATKLEVDNSPVKRTYLQLTVSGTGGHAVVSATLRLRVASSSGADSDTRGRVHAAACGWSEATLSGTTNPQPAITPTVLSAPAGTAAPGQTVDFDVTGAITHGDGTYCVAIDSTSTDGVDFVSREASTGRPTLVVTVAP